MEIHQSDAEIDLGDLTLDGLLAGAIRDRLEWMRGSTGLFHTPRAKSAAWHQVRIAIEAIGENGAVALPKAHDELARIAADPWCQIDANTTI
jgi:hypothetical protein